MPGTTLVTVVVGRGALLPPRFGIGVVTVFTCVVVVAIGAIVVGRGPVLPGSTGNGVVTVFGTVVNDRAAFF
jgi:hypothetical protein